MTQTQKTQEATTPESADEAFMKLNRQLYQTAYDLSAQAISPEEISIADRDSLKAELLGHIEESNIGYEALAELCEGYYSEEEVEAFKEDLRSLAESNDVKKTMKSKALTLLARLEDEPDDQFPLLDQAIAADRGNIAARGMRYALYHQHAHEYSHNDPVIKNAARAFGRNDFRYLRNHGQYDLNTFTLRHYFNLERVSEFDLQEINRQVEIFDGNPDALYLRAMVQFKLNKDIDLVISDIDASLDIVKTEEALDLQLRACKKACELLHADEASLKSNMPRIKSYAQKGRDALNELLESAIDEDPYSDNTFELFKMDREFDALTHESQTTSLQNMKHILERQMYQEEPGRYYRRQMLFDKLRTVTIALANSQLEDYDYEAAKRTANYLLRLCRQEGETSRAVLKMAGDVYEYFDANKAYDYYKQAASL